MDEPGTIEKVKVREVTGVFPSDEAIISAVDDLLLAGFERADIDVVADGPQSNKGIDASAIPAVELADVPDAPRQEFVAPEDTVAIYALCVAIIGCFGATIGALVGIASRGTTAFIVLARGTIAFVIYCVVVGAILGCGLGVVFARLMGWRWIQAPNKLASSDGLVLWVRVRRPDHEQKALRILKLRGAEAVRVHEIERSKRMDDLPLRALRPDPWLGNERLGAP
jgi:hypothetical protein